ncbi:hypothetical protein LSH36_98g05052 [Paralvinella palmiformis]|uniref:Protein sleepless n=1 Tax=Paralvinella palmiformis TaxID=53620 RepID=A0AAD9K0J0_9ANNE|nr:hypothetical protein LSH36_98g05052 [Paralvinella palmiformis]
MKTLLWILPCSLVLFMVLLEVSGQSKPIKCYQCNSFYDKGCADFFDNTTYPLIPCPINATKCRKIIQETYYDGIWDVRYVRQCAIEGEVGPAEGRWCKERTGTWRVKVKYCHCDNKDGCNGSSTFSTSYAIMFAATLLSLFSISTFVSNIPGS